MDIVELFSRFGFDFEHDASIVLDLLVLYGSGFLVSWIVLFVVRRYIHPILVIAAQKTKVTWDDIILDKVLFNRVTFLFPLILFKLLTLIPKWEYIWIIDKSLDIAIVLQFAMILLSFTHSLNRVYESFSFSKNRPLKSLFQAINVISFSLAILLIISIIIDKSFSSIIIGLGAFAAVAMLVFKDTILSFVAGLQIITNQMVRIGDWIVSKDGTADGTVTDISLYTVTVQNWDRTTTLIPTNILIADTFINYRTMEEGGGRKIQRSINLDMNSVRFVSKEELLNFKESEIISPFIERLLDSYLPDGGYSNLDAARVTNLGLFRNYLKLWLVNNPAINQEMTVMVRQLDPTASGIPLELYCFTKDTAWLNYEIIQSELFDHILSIVPLFGLKVYQYPNTLNVLHQN